MRNSIHHSRIYLIILAVIIAAMMVAIDQTILAAATVTPTESPIAVDTLNATLTSTPVSTIVPSAAATATGTRPRTQVPSATLPDTPTSTPIAPVAPTTIPQTALFAQEIPLAAYGLHDLETGSPFGSVEFPFTLPTNWLVDGNNFLNLNVEYLKTNSSTADATQNSVLQVRLDNQLALSVVLTPDALGSRNIRVPLRIGLLANQGRRRHAIQVTLDARSICLANAQAHVIIRSDLSYFHFEYREGTPLRDLASFPQPLFNDPVGTQVDSVLFVMPSKYTADDLQAGAAIAAELGRVTNNKLQIRLTTADAVSAQDQQSTNMIAIGQLGTNALIDSLYSAKLLPTTLETNGSLSVNNKPIADTDGIIEIIADPKNALRSILVVTGKTRAALDKAASAMAGPLSVLRLGGGLALISDVHPMAIPQLGPYVSFASLSYSDVILTGFGSSTDYSFNAPLGMTLTSGAYVDINYDLADTLQAAQTSITMTMNDFPVDSVPVGGNAFTTDAAGERHLRASIPPNSVTGGATNDFTISVDVRGNWQCNPPSDAAAWFLIRASSEFYLPFRKADLAAARPVLSVLPSPFNVTPDLSDTLFSLPDQPTQAELEQMMRLASFFGSQGSPIARYAPRVALGQIGTDIDRSAYHFVVIGRVSTNPLLSQFNDMKLLPQPFEKDDELKQVMDGVILRLPASYNLGVLELFKSPWSPEHVALAITGTSSIGQDLAANVLLSGKYRVSDLEGNIVFANATTISIVDTTSQQSDQTLTPQPTTLSSQTAAASVTSGPASAATVVPPTVPVYTVTPYPTNTPVPTDVQW